ncbi:MAG: sulfatase-like hydrolase/transferase [Flavobacteriales bacterium]|nr:sulfatase-like hydrolase/transferase [Flavobacteriales bacterium]
MRNLRGPLLVMLARMGALALVYTLLRIAFVLLNRDAFPNVPFAAYWGGIRFDLSVLAWLNLPWIVLCLAHDTEQGWFARVKQTMFVVVNAIGFFFACADLEYYKFTLKRSTADLFGIMAGGGDTGSLATVFAKEYWYIVLLFIACLVFAWWAYRRAARLSASGYSSPDRRIMWRVVTIALLVLASRGGVQLIPIGVMNAADHVPPPYFSVVLNTPFTIMMTWGKPVVEKKAYMTQEEADRLWPVEHQYSEQKNTPESIAIASTRPNVVLLILESFSAAYSAKLSGNEGYMPFLDSLMAQSLTFTRAYANGRRSIDGIPAITAAIPELMDEAFITSVYAQTPFTSMANLLAEEGYSTSFYHGGRNGTMGFDSFAKSAGYARYRGLEEYPVKEDYDGSWGIWDRPYLQYVANELSQEQQPFFSTVFTLSSHHPYHLLPEDAERFAGGTLRIHPSLRYTDDALRRFFETARKQPWFGNTLFIITADHTADIDRTGQQYSEAVDYWVPLLFHMPEAIAPRTVDRVTQHIDIVPTAMDLIGMTRPFFSFGSSALRDERAPMAVTRTTGSYLAIDADGVVRSDGNGTSSSEKESVLQAAIQQFNNRLLRQELTLP